MSIRYGFLPDTIWNHPSNQNLKDLRKDMNVLMPGDMVVIPDREPKELPRPVDQKYVFQRKGTLALYRLQVFDYEEPRALQKYRLVVDGALTFEGTTDKSGTLEHHIPAKARRGELVIGEDEARLTIRFGYLDPIKEIAGLQKRLTNLGFLKGEATGNLDSDTEEALKVFQLRFGLDPTGQPDDDTVAKLIDMHDVISEFPPEPEVVQPQDEPDGGE